MRSICLGDKTVWKLPLEIAKKAIYPARQINLLMYFFQWVPVRTNNIPPVINIIKAWLYYIYDFEDIKFWSGKQPLGANFGLESMFANGPFMRPFSRLFFQARPLFLFWWVARFCTNYSWKHLNEKFLVSKAFTVIIKKKCLLMLAISKAIYQDVWVTQFFLLNQKKMP